MVFINCVSATIFVFVFSVSIGLSAQCVQGTCKPGWCQAPLGKPYCYQAIQLNDAESGGWLDQVMACNKTGVPYAYPLMETDTETLDHILIPRTHGFIQTIFTVGAYNETGMGPQYLDGSSTFPYRLCEQADFMPWDTNAFCAPNCGKCGFVMSSFNFNFKDYCMAFLPCDAPDYEISQFQHMLCQYQQKAENMTCPTGFQAGPLGDRCFKFVPDAHLSWLDAFCDSVYQGYELAIVNNLLDLWWISNELAKITDAGLGAFMGATSLGSKKDNFVWIDGSKMQPFVSFTDSLGGNKCITVATDIEDFPEKLFFSSFDYIDCADQSKIDIVTIPAVYEFTPHSASKVPEEILCAVANTGAEMTQYQFCQDLLKLHSCKKAT